MTERAGVSQLVDNALAAGEAMFSELKNVCVWNKTNRGMGSFYRSKHELVFVFKVGGASLRRRSATIVADVKRFCRQIRRTKFSVRTGP